MNPELKDLQALLDRTVLTVLMVLTELLVWTVAMVPMEKKEKLDPSDPLVYLVSPERTEILENKDLKEKLDPLVRYKKVTKENLENLDLTETLEPLVIREKLENLENLDLMENPVKWASPVPREQREIKDPWVRMENKEL